MSARRQRVARVGVFVVVALAVVAGVARLQHAFGLLDWRADLNASRTYLDRSYADNGQVIEDRRVVEDARLWMPEDATYRLVIGERKSRVRFSDVAPDFLRYFLLPRRESADAQYVFCINCRAFELGDDVELLSRGRSILFGRLRQ